MIPRLSFSVKSSMPRIRTTHFIVNQKDLDLRPLPRAFGISVSKTTTR
jgi:hypothetical protein